MKHCDWERDAGNCKAWSKKEKHTNKGGQENKQNNKEKSVFKKILNVN